jgi:hypothetical protein
VVPPSDVVPVSNVVPPSDIVPVSNVVATSHIVPLSDVPALVGHVSHLQNRSCATCSAPMPPGMNVAIQVQRGHTPLSPQQVHQAVEKSRSNFDFDGAYRMSRHDFAAQVDTIEQHTSLSADPVSRTPVLHVDVAVQIASEQVQLVHTATDTSDADLDVASFSNSQHGFQVERSPVVLGIGRHCRTDGQLSAVEAATQVEDLGQCDRAIQVGNDMSEWPGETVAFLRSTSACRSAEAQEATRPSSTGYRHQVTSTTQLDSTPSRIPHDSLRDVVMRQLESASKPSLDRKRLPSPQHGPQDAPRVIFHASTTYSEAIPSSCPPDEPQVEGTTLGCASTFGETAGTGRAHSASRRSQERSLDTEKCEQATETGATFLCQAASQTAPCFTSDAMPTGNEAHDVAGASTEGRPSLMEFGLETRADRPECVLQATVGIQTVGDPTPIRCGVDEVSQTELLQSMETQFSNSVIQNVGNVMMLDNMHHTRVATEGAAAAPQLNSPSRLNDVRAASQSCQTEPVFIQSSETAETHRDNRANLHGTATQTICESPWSIAAIGNNETLLPTQDAQLRLLSPRTEVLTGTRSTQIETELTPHRTAVQEAGTQTFSTPLLVNNGNVAEPPTCDNVAQTVACSSTVFAGAPETTIAAFTASVPGVVDSGHSRIPFRETGGMQVLTVQRPESAVHVGAKAERNGDAFSTSVHTFAEICIDIASACADHTACGAFEYANAVLTVGQSSLRDVLGLTAKLQLAEDRIRVLSEPCHACVGLQTKLSDDSVEMLRLRDLIHGTDAVLRERTRELTIFRNNHRDVIILTAELASTKALNQSLTEQTAQLARLLADAFSQLLTSASEFADSAHSTHRALGVCGAESHAILHLWRADATVHRRALDSLTRQVQELTVTNHQLSTTISDLTEDVRTLTEVSSRTSATLRSVSEEYSSAAVQHIADRERLSKEIARIETAHASSLKHGHLQVEALRTSLDTVTKQLAGTRQRVVELEVRLAAVPDVALVVRSEVASATSQLHEEIEKLRTNLMAATRRLKQYHVPLPEQGDTSLEAVEPSQQLEAVQAEMQALRAQLDCQGTKLGLQLHDALEAQDALQREIAEINGPLHDLPGGTEAMQQLSRADLILALHTGAESPSRKLILRCAARDAGRVKTSAGIPLTEAVTPVSLLRTVPPLIAGRKLLDQSVLLRSNFDAGSTTSGDWGPLTTTLLCCLHAADTFALNDASVWLTFATSVEQCCGRGSFSNARTAARVVHGTFLVTHCADQFDAVRKAAMMCACALSFIITDFWASDARDAEPSMLSLFGDEAPTKKATLAAARALVKKLCEPLRVATLDLLEQLLRDAELPRDQAALLVYFFRHTVHWMPKVQQERTAVHMVVETRQCRPSETAATITDTLRATVPIAVKCMERLGSLLPSAIRERAAHHAFLWTDSTDYLARLIDKAFASKNECAAARVAYGKTLLTLCCPVDSRSVASQCMLDQLPLPPRANDAPANTPRQQPNGDQLEAVTLRQQLRHMEMQLLEARAPRPELLPHPTLKRVVRLPELAQARTPEAHSKSAGARMIRDTVPEVHSGPSRNVVTGPALSRLSPGQHIVPLPKLRKDKWDIAMGMYP